MKLITIDAIIQVILRCSIGLGTTLKPSKRYIIMENSIVYQITGFLYNENSRKIVKKIQEKRREKNYLGEVLLAVHRVPVLQLAEHEGEFGRDLEMVDARHGSSAAVQLSILRITIHEGGN